MSASISSQVLWLAATPPQPKPVANFHRPLGYWLCLTYHCSRTIHRPSGEFFFENSETFWISTNQRKVCLGQTRSRSVASCFGEKWVRRIVPLIYWDFFADSFLRGGGGVDLGVVTI